MPIPPPILPGKHQDRTQAAISRRLSPALLTVDDVAEHIGASTRHVRRLIERGQLPIIRIGKLVRVAPDDLARLIAASRES